MGNLAPTIQAHPPLLAMALAAKLTPDRRIVRLIGVRDAPIDPCDAKAFETSVFARIPLPDYGYLIVLGDGPAAKEFLSICISGTDFPALEREVRAVVCRFGFPALEAAIEGLDQEQSVNETIRIDLSEGSVRVRTGLLALAKRELQILQLMALSRRPISTEQLIDEIWPDDDPWHARTNLKVHMHRLRTRLGRRDAILCCGGRWQLGSNVSVDLWDWQDLMKETRTVELTEERRTSLTHALTVIERQAAFACHDTSIAQRIESALQSLARAIATRLLEDALARADPVRALAVAGDLLTNNTPGVGWQTVIARARAQL